MVFWDGLGHYLSDSPTHLFLNLSLRDGNGDGDGGDVDLQQPAEPDDQEVAMWILDTRRSPRR